MGAWTSTFTIGFTLAYAPSIIHQPFLQLKDVSIPNQPIWAKDQARTGHPDLGKVVLYQMSYFRGKIEVCYYTKIRDSLQSTCDTL